LKGGIYISPKTTELQHVLKALCFAKEWWKINHSKMKFISQMVNPVIPDVLKTNVIPGGGSRSPPYENNEVVLLGPYSQKTFLKGTNFIIVSKNWNQISKIGQDFEILKNWSGIGQFRKLPVTRPILEILGSSFLQTSSF
jgi:hypothetical protein